MIIRESSNEWEEDLAITEAEQISELLEHIEVETESSSFSSAGSTVVQDHPDLSYTTNKRESLL